MFSKIDKKILIWLVIAVIAIALVGIALYVQYSAGGASVENIGVNNDNSEPQNKEGLDGIDVKVDLGGAQVEGDSRPGGLIICSDRCGDGFCQTQDDPDCPEESLNCVCIETSEECPQDCGSKN